MAWYHKFPWTNFHELNLDWILEICGKAEKAIPNIDDAIVRADNAADNANNAADLANHNATTANNAAAVANNAARKIDPITATAATVHGASASVTVKDTNPGKVFHFLIPAGEKGDPGPSGGAGDLIDNGNFTNPINQRGATSYNGNGSKMYTIDRWFTESNASPAVTINNKYITVAPGAEIKQIIPAENLAEFPSDIDVGYTAVARETNGTVHIANSGLTDSKLSFVLGDADSGITVTVGSGNWEYCALYKGIFTAENVPGYMAKDYVSQLFECYRYFRKTVLHGVSETNKYIAPVNTFDPPFRIKPTITADANFGAPGVGGPSASNITIVAYTDFIQEIADNNSGLTPGVLYRLYITASADM